MPGVHFNPEAAALSTRRTRLAFTLAAALCPALAQLPPPDDQAPAEPQMVDLNVVALDSRGDPVTDLRPDELRVTDNNKPQAIAFFHHREAAPGRPPAPAAGEFTNRGPANIPRATLILFDLMNESFGTRGTSANQLVHELASLETADYVYLYILRLDGRLYPVHGLPGPEDRPPSPGDAPWTRQIKPLLDNALRTVQQLRPVDTDVAVRAQLTMRALDAIAADLSRVPGYKSIVWVTDGVPLVLGPRRSDTGDFVDFTPLIRQMSEAFNRSRVSIYPVRQVMLGSADNVDGAAHDGMESIETLSLFANLTGGRPDVGKDIGAAVRQAIIDMRTSYQLGYCPPARNWDNKLHKLRVTCTRKGVRIQSKTGYYAWEDPPGARGAQAIESIARATFDAAEIGLQAKLSGSSGGLVHLDAHIDLRDLALVRSGDFYDGHLRLAVVGYAQGELSQRTPIIPLDLHLTSQAHDQALQQGIPFSQDLNMSKEVRSIRLILFDRGSDSVGSLTIPVPPVGR